MEYNPIVGILEPEGGRMIKRKRMLPEGWYPFHKNETEAYLDGWSRTDSHSHENNAIAAIAPHAGWYYSGRIAWSAWLSAIQADEVLIIGGHLQAGSAFRYWKHDVFESPFGDIKAATELVSFLRYSCNAEEDNSVDNTIEVHLPMMAYRFPGATLACFRAPNDKRSAELGVAAASYAKTTGKRLFVLASTDMTHYGKSYEFEPAGHGAKGFAWARKKDEALCEAFLSVDMDKALLLAARDSSACSVGAAVAAMTYASEMGYTSSKLLMRGSSDEMHLNSDASVGYCSIAFMS